jgi:hypothetical protein
MKKIIPVVVASLCFSMATTAQSNQTLNLSKGQKYQVDNKLETTSSTDVQGQTMESKANISSSYNIEVKDKKADTYQLSNTLTHMQMSMSMMGNDITFDSDKKEDMDGEIGSGLKEYLNQPKDVVLDNTGKVISDISDSSASDIAKQLNLSATGYGAQMTFLALPKNLKVGSSWSDSSDENGIKRTTNYTVKSLDGNIATIAFSGTVSTDATMERQGMEISTKTTGKFSGEEKVNSKTGVIQSTTSTGESTGTVNAMGQEFPMSTKVTSTTTVKEL